MLKIAVIIPVKTFSKAKTRLDLPDHTKVSLCKMMLEEMLQVLASSRQVSETIVVTGDDAASDISKRYDATVIRDDTEQGVNHAVSLADGHIKDGNFGASIVLPQDVPLITGGDIEFLLKIQIPPNFVTIVPSRKFDGTNALLRMPHDIMDTHYDQDSYRAHVRTAKEHTRNSSIIFIDRIMTDIDDIDDLRHALNSNQKPAWCQKVRELADI